MNKWTAVAFGLVAFALAACAKQPLPASEGDVPGFLMGLVHGFIAPVSLVAHLFDHSIRIYAFPNSGGWYDFGFVFGIGALLGGGASRL